MGTNRAIYKLVLSIPRAKKGEHTARATTIAALTQKVTELEYQINLTEKSNHYFELFFHHIDSLEIVKFQ